MRLSSFQVGTKIPCEFEATMSGSGGDLSPQMFHIDSLIARVAATQKLTAQPGSVRSAEQGPTQVVAYAHRFLQDMTHQEAITYFTKVFDKVHRATARTEEEWLRTVRQDAVVEQLESGTHIEQGESKDAGMSLFLTDHLHRGAPSNGVGYGFFCSWRIPEYAHVKSCTNGLPITKLNFLQQLGETEQQFQQLFRN